MLDLDPPPKVITFDCYGTLVRWHETMREAVRAILHQRVAVDASKHLASAIADRLRKIAGERQQQRPFQGYESVLQASLAQAFSEVGYEATAADFDTLRATLNEIAPHPEVPAALARLRAHYKIAIISNTADDLIAGTVRAIGTPIDFVITADQVRAYKPDHQLFLKAYAIMGVTGEETVHVGMGQFTDLKVCRELGVRSIWIDRLGKRSTRRGRRTPHCRTCRDFRTFSSGRRLRPTIDLFSWRRVGRRGDGLERQIRSAKPNAKTSIAAAPRTLLTLWSLPQVRSRARLTGPAWIGAIALSCLLVGIIARSVNGQFASNNPLPRAHSHSPDM
jgi:2-haloacid dehalogenase